MIGMGEIRARIRLENLEDKLLCKAGHLAKKKIRVKEIEAIVDTGAVMVLLPQDLVDALGLERIERMTVILADDRKVAMDRSGPLALTVVGRSMVTDCLVGPPGCQALIGQIVMEQLDLIPDPVQRTLTVRPESPYRPTINLKFCPPPIVCASV